MITITKINDMIEIQGHSKPEICAAVSTTMYIGVNILLAYDDGCVDFKDFADSILPVDKVQIKVLKHDLTIDKIIDVMISGFKDICEENDDEVKLIIGRG